MDFAEPQSTKLVSRIVAGWQNTPFVGYIAEDGGTDLADLLHRSMRLRAGRLEVRRIVCERIDVDMQTGPERNDQAEKYKSGDQTGHPVA